MMQLVVKAILGAFDIKPATKDLDNDVNSRSVSSTIAKV
jgi:hypothetical protein